MGGEGAGLGVGTIVGRDRHGRERSVEVLVNSTAVVGHEQGVALGHAEPDGPFDDAVVTGQRLALGAQEIDAVREADVGPAPLDGRPVLADGMTERGLGEDAETRGDSRPVLGSGHRGAEPGERQVTGRGIAETAVRPDRDHDAHVAGGAGGLGDIVEHTEALDSLVEVAHRAVVDTRGHGRDESRFELIEHDVRVRPVRLSCRVRAPRRATAGW